MAFKRYIISVGITEPKPLCGLKYGKFKPLSKNKINFFRNSLIILYS